MVFRSVELTESHGVWHRTQGDTSSFTVATVQSIKSVDVRFRSGPACAAMKGSNVLDYGAKEYLPADFGARIITRPNALARG